MARCEDCDKLLTQDDFKEKNVCRSCYLKGAFQVSIGSTICGVLACVAAAFALYFALTMLKDAESAPEEPDFYYVGIIGIIYAMGTGITWGTTILFSFATVIQSSIALYRRGFVAYDSHKKNITILVCGISGLVLFSAAVIMLIASYGVIHWR